MKLKYEDFYIAYEQFVKDAESVEDWRSVRFLYDHFKQRFVDKLSSMRAKRRRLDQEQEMAIPVEPAKPKNSLADLMKNVDNQNLKAQKSLKVQEIEALEEEEEKELRDLEEEKLQLKCISCEEVFNDVKFEEVVYLEQCCHTVCKKCIEERVLADYPEVTCPDEDCNKLLPEYEIENLVGKEKLAELQKKMVNKVLADEKGIIYCKCGNAIEFLQGKIYYDIKKEDGTAISKTAAKHMSQHRIRCNECSINFCKSCKVEPYHIGMTCA
jgi:hypothetical protein